MDQPKTARRPDMGTAAWYDEWLTRIAALGLAFIIGWEAHADYYHVNQLWQDIGRQTHSKGDTAK